MSKKYAPYRNRFEQQTAEALTSNKRLFLYEYHKIPYTVSGTYLVDFSITKKDGSIMHIETKGNGLSFDGHSRRKLRAVKAQNPTMDLRLVFYSDGKCGPKRKDGTFMRQSDWATKYGFKYAIKEIPKDWYAEWGL